MSCLCVVVLPCYLSYTELVGAQDPICASLEVDKIICHSQVAVSESTTTHHTILSVQDAVDPIFAVHC